MIDCKNLLRADAILAVRLDEHGDSYKLGNILAPIFSLNWENPKDLSERRLFGLAGGSYIGKTSFLRGVRSNLSSSFCFEAREDKNPKGKPIKQSWEHSENAGHLRFIDAGLNKPHQQLHSIRNQTVNAPQEPGTDFIEHADYLEQHEAYKGLPASFYGALSLQWSMDDTSRYRAARLYASDAMTQTQSFQDAVQNARQRFAPEPAPKQLSAELVALFA